MKNIGKIILSLFLGSALILVLRMSYVQYKVKSRKSEAVVSLTSIYTAQKLFFENSNTYASCIKDMGYDPSFMAETRYYAVGFHMNFFAQNKVARNKGVKCSDGKNGQSFFSAGKSLAGKPLTRPLISKIAPRGKSYLATAFTQLPHAVVKNGHGQNDAIANEVKDQEFGLDVWAISNKKEVIHIETTNKELYEEIKDILKSIQ